MIRHWLSSALWFCAPFAVLLVVWAVLVPYFDVNPRLFPHLDSLAQAGVDGIEDGTLIRHIGASLLRVAVGTVLALVFAIPLGINRQNSTWKQNTTERTDENIRHE